MRPGVRPGAVLLLLLLGNIAFAQQLRLGNQPYTVEKSAVLELVSNNQGLLFPRITDTAVINVLSPPDGMVIYFTVTKQLLVRANGYWQALRTKPVYYSGGIGGTAATETVTKIWIAEVANVAGGTQTINIPANVGFTTIISIQLTAKGGSSTATAPIAMVTSNTTSSIVIRVVESKLTTVVLGGNVEGLEAHGDTNTKIYIRVEGN